MAQQQTSPTADELETSQPVIPEADRPQPSSPASENGESSGDNEGPADKPKRKYPSGAEKRKRAAARAAGGGAAPKPRGGVSVRASQGGTIFYGGIGAVFYGTGVLPAAGITMTGLADEAGPEVAKWAKAHAPWFYRFLSGLADIGGPGKYLGAPLVAEVHARAEPMRPMLEMPLELALGEDGAAGIRQMEAELYDPARREREQAQMMADAEHAAQAGASPFPMPEPPTP